jgi:hypothetical protein
VADCEHRTAARTVLTVEGTGMQAASRTARILPVAKALLVTTGRPALSLGHMSLRTLTVLHLALWCLLIQSAFKAQRR